jgi:hypothetical protein
VLPTPGYLVAFPGLATLQEPQYHYKGNTVLSSMAKLRSALRLVACVGSIDKTPTEPPFVTQQATHLVGNLTLRFVVGLDGASASNSREERFECLQPHSKTSWLKRGRVGALVVSTGWPQLHRVPPQV